VADAFSSYIVSRFAPIQYLRLGEPAGVGTVATDEMGLTNGTYVDNLQHTKGVAGGVTGSSDTAVSFTGVSNGHVDANLTIPAASVRTIACLIKRTDTSSWDPIFGSYGASYDFALVSGSHEIAMYGPSGGLLDTFTTSDLSALSSDTDGNWHSVVCVMNQPTNTITVWFDASTVSRATLTEDGSASNISYGYDVGGGEWLKGSMDEVIVCDYAWVQADVDDFRNAVAGSIPSTATPNSMNSTLWTPGLFGPGRENIPDLVPNVFN
jgi:hypothetical protein